MIQKINVSLSIILTFFLFVASCKSETNLAINQEDFTSKLESVKATINKKSVEDLVRWQTEYKMFILLDVRTFEEYNTNYIPGAVNLPRGLLEFRIDKDSFWEEEGLYAPLKEDLILVYCKSGNRSALAVQTLENLGYTNVHFLEGGIIEWIKQYPDNVLKNITPDGDNSEMVTDAEEGVSC